MGEKEKKIKKIQVPNSLILDKRISHNAFALYVILKNFSFNDNVNIYPTKLLKAIEWKDMRTLKKYLEILNDLKYINMITSKIVKYECIKLTIRGVENDFTQVDINTMYKIIECTLRVPIKGNDNEIEVKNLKEMALRLFYYYEKNYNTLLGKAFPSYRKTSEELCIGKSYISALNDIFNKNDIVKVKKGNWVETEYEDGVILPRRMCNEYIPICSR
ncbi:hypothetical protein [Tepidibacter hydrothermalis]|uniref:Uncharacterized protein n=1 Tax=Tepidibacter hydrothermalis TaxID=3036126 RepID=A0ABY8E866_9FIRM|nr:hypothetical protein [Tepidibacter hydrothermalis]WFD09039.1 hypothetical protein P4S50_11645 [Tepidibacter hydrothermalis]